MKTLFLILVVLFIGISSSADYGPINMREGANITLDGGKIFEFQTDGIWNVLAYGAIPDDELDDAQAIQDCINASSAAGGGIVYIPPGNYSIASRHGGPWETYGEGGTMISMRSNISVIGAGRGITRLRVADNMRTSTLACAILMNWDQFNVTSNWSICDITFDGNYEHNQFQAGWTSRFDSVGAINASDYRIERCEFVNTMGYWCVITGVGSGTGIFRDNIIHGTVSDPDMDDFTCVYLSGDRVIAQGNFIDVTSADAIYAGLEMHCTDGFASQNTILNVTHGIWASHDSANPGSVLKIHDNRVRAFDCGILTSGSTTHQGEAIEIYNNDISCSVYGISMETGVGRRPIKKLKISDNIIHGFNGANITYGIKAQEFIDGEISRNSIYNSTTVSTWIIASGTNTLIMENNNLNGYGYGPTSKAGIWVEVKSNISNLVIKSNDMYNITNALGPTYGVILNSDGAYVVTGEITDNIITGLSTSASEQIILDTDLSTSGDIRMEKRASAAPSGWGLWFKNSVIWNSNLAAGQPLGWACTATGSSGGTWKAMANLAS